MGWFLLAVGVWNLCVFIVYGIDKIKAIYGSWRISELCLLILAALLGGVGGMLGMFAFRHKIRKAKFWLVYIFAFIDIVLVMLICIYAF